MLPIENQRLEQLIKQKCYGNNSAFADKLGLSPTHINRLFKIDKRKGSYPSVLKSPAVLKAIEDVFPDIDINWFADSNEDNVGYKKDKFVQLLEDKLQDRQYIIELLENQNKRLQDDLERLRKKLKKNV